jgi:hypothetical protein
LKSTVLGRRRVTLVDMPLSNQFSLPRTHMAATLQTDGSGHLDAEVENIRITYVSASDRKPEADWAGSDVLRIQAYRGSDSKSLFMGAE